MYGEKLKLCGNLRKHAETRKGFLYCWNCTETFYIRFQLTETLRKLFSLFLHCWNWTETYTSGFRWRKLDGIQLKLYNSFRIAETIQETSTPSFYIVLAVFQFCWNSIFHPVQIMLDQIQSICKRHLKQPDLTDVQNLLHRLRSVLVYFEFWYCWPLFEICFNG